MIAIATQEARIASPAFAGLPRLAATSGRAAGCTQPKSKQKTNCDQSTGYHPLSLGQLGFESESQSAEGWRIFEPIQLSGWAVSAESNSSTFTNAKVLA